MVEIVLHVDVDAAVEETWEAAVDWEFQQQWMMLTHSVLGTDQAGRGVGGGIEALTGFGPLSVKDTMVITSWEPPHRCFVRHTGRIVRGTGAFEVLELPDGRSRFRWSEWLELPLGRLGAVGFRLFRPLVVAGLRRSLRSFARQVERRAAGAAGSDPKVR